MKSLKKAARFMRLFLMAIASVVLYLMVIKYLSQVFVLNGQFSDLFKILTFTGACYFLWVISEPKTTDSSPATEETPSETS